MKILKVILISLLLIGCSEATPPKKPFIIIYKFPEGANCNSGWCSYKYMDVNGNIFHFCEDETKYDIGDLIK